MRSNAAKSGRKPLKDKLSRHPLASEFTCRGSLQEGGLQLRDFQKLAGWILDWLDNTPPPRRGGGPQGKFNKKLVFLLRMFFPGQNMLKYVFYVGCCGDQKTCPLCWMLMWDQETHRSYAGRNLSGWWVRCWPRGCDLVTAQEICIFEFTTTICTFTFTLIVMHSSQIWDTNC